MIHDQISLQYCVLCFFSPQGWITTTGRGSVSIGKPKDQIQRKEMSPKKQMRHPLRLAYQVPHLLSKPPDQSFSNPWCSQWGYVLPVWQWNKWKIDARSSERWDSMIAVDSMSVYRLLLWCCSHSAIRDPEIESAVCQRWRKGSTHAREV